MTPQEQMDSLIDRLSTIAAAHADLLDFWSAVDAEMESIVAAAETEKDQRIIDERYRVLMEKADLMGIMQPE